LVKCGTQTKIGTFDVVSEIREKGHFKQCHYLWIVSIFQRTVENTEEDEVDVDEVDIESPSSVSTPDNRKSPETKVAERPVSSNAHSSKKRMLEDSKSCNRLIWGNHNI
jgi:hypothetical protein